MNRTVTYSTLALYDLEKISLWTIAKFGRAQADRYLASFEDRCAELAIHPEHARPHAGRIRNARRMEHVSHVIFFTVDSNGITVQRVLHQGQLPTKQGL